MGELNLKRKGVKLFHPEGVSINMNEVPTHIAFVMDGNRRWAKEKGLDKFKGHEAGINNIENIVKASSDLGVKYVTFWALSTENIKERSKIEVLGLFNSLRKSFQNQFPRMMKEGVKIKVIGEEKGLPSDIKKIVNKLNKTLVKNPKIRLNIAFNYGGKVEILNAIKKIIEEKIPSEKIDKALIERYLYTSGIPDPELIIRTGGKKRLSGYLLWQSEYSELYFVDTYWPDFDKNELKKAISWFAEQERNFGR